VRGCCLARADIDPLDFSVDLPRVMMVEVSHDPLEVPLSRRRTGRFGCMARN